VIFPVSDENSKLSRKNSQKFSPKMAFVDKVLKDNADHAVIFEAQIIN
jgi:hypothetical protein